MQTPRIEGFHKGKSCLDFTQFEAPFLLETEGNNKLVSTNLKPHKGKEVTVAWLADHSTGRNSFDTQISVKGILDFKDEEDTTVYQVLLDNQNYSYFSDSNVWQISQREGSNPIIMIDLTSESKIDYNNFL